MTARARILVVDDEPEMVRLVADIARDHGHEPTGVTAPALVLPLLEEASFDLVVTDVRMPEVDGIELIERVAAFDPRIAIVAMTAFGSIDTAVRAVRAGAFDYVPKPFQPADIALRMERALEHRAMTLELSHLRSAVAERFSTAGIIGRSRALEDVITLVRRVADGAATVLVTGPSGSGKELVARALHGESRRRSRRFVAVSCAAIPESLLEAELFGVRKGAYTDARSDRAGLFQQAEGGTLFLDEIGELALPLQAKLLRALQEREIRPLGAASAEPVDVRVVAATNRDLRAAVRERAFREDLFYRLAVIEISIPPLMDRREDILPLAEHFLAQAAARAGKPIAGFSGAAVNRLLAHDWPGNARELENAVERAAALCEGDRILPDDLPESLKARRAPDFLEAAADRMMTLEELQRAYAQLILRRVGNKKQRAAALLGIDRRTLQRWFGEERGEDEGG
ncbi:MAG: sigma-54-dependent Fis family transcriptional regulator [Polyangiaceae bacterium]|nr:sigma-54-dependent Fis family transcriptional regulator [Polyangiaceae bacterium]